MKDKTFYLDEVVMNTSRTPSQVWEDELSRVQSHLNEAQKAQDTMFSMGGDWEIAMGSFYGQSVRASREKVEEVLARKPRE